MVHAERLDGRRGEVERRLLVGLVEGGGNEEPGLAEVLRHGEAAGEGQVADDAARGDALHRDVGGVGPVRPRRIVGQVPLEDHVRPGRSERVEKVVQVRGVVDRRRCSGSPGPSGA